MTTTVLSERRLEAIATQDDWQQDWLQQEAAYDIHHLVTPSWQKPDGIHD